MRPRWWFGGVASTGVACLVAPFDLVKTHMQTQVVKKGMVETSLKVIKLRGLRGFYDGFAAAAARQMICTSMRFSLYEFAKNLELMRDNLGSKTVFAGVAGLGSSIIGIPLDVINIRMQNDMKGDEESKRRYKNLLDAFSRIPREEGWKALYNGGSAAVVKAAVGSIGQIAVYDQVKSELAAHYDMDDNISLHFKSSLVTSIIDCIITQPFDVLKTLMMNGRPGQFPTILHATKHMLRFGYMGLYRGLLPTVVRKAPATILLYLIYEQLRLNWGNPNLSVKF